MPDDKVNPYEMLTQMFSQDGYSNGAFCLRLKDTCSFNLSKQDDKYKIEFYGKKPEVSVGKMFSLKTTVPAITLGVNGGVLELDNFPDIPFFYTWIMQDELQPIGFNKQDLAELFTRAAAQKLVNSIIDMVVDSVATEEPKNE